MPFPTDFNANLCEGFFHELAYRMSFSSRQHIVAGFLLLEHQPHSTDILSGMPPVTLGIKISEKKLVLESQMNGRDSARDLSSNESFPTGRSFMIKQNAI